MMFKTYLKIIEYSVFVILLIALFWLFKAWRSEREEHLRYQNNYKTATSQMAYFRTSTGQQYAIGGTLTLTRDEVKDSLIEVIRSMNVKPRLINSISNVGLRDSTHLIVKVIDTLVYDSVHAEFADYLDKYTEFKFLKINDTARVTFTTTAALMQVIHKEKKGFKFWKATWWQRRPLMQTITCDNPNVFIKYSEFITIKKE